jgi:hypothetical protein
MLGKTSLYTSPAISMPINSNINNFIILKYQVVIFNQNFYSGMYVIDYHFICNPFSIIDNKLHSFIFLTDLNIGKSRREFWCFQ